MLKRTLANWNGGGGTSYPITDPQERWRPAIATFVGRVLFANQLKGTA